MPDKLLEEVKDEQRLAREANRGARGSAMTNRGGRGGPTRGTQRSYSISILNDMLMLFLTCRTRR